MNKKSVKVFAPATVANMGCGFDIMGFAIESVGDVVEMSVSEGDSITIVNNSGVYIPVETDKNVMVPPLKAMMEKMGKTYAIDIVIHSKIRPGSGIGSSAASSAAAAFALNHLCGNVFSETELVFFASLGEKLISGDMHADNVAPAIMGGIVLVRDYNPLEAIKLDSPIKLYCAVAHPFIEVKTKDSRAVLKKEIPLSDAIKQWANVGALVAGIFQGDTTMIGRAMCDVVAEPYRKKFIPGFDEIKDIVLKNGALAFNISGSGPSVFALCRDKEDAQRVAELMKNFFTDKDIDSDCYVSAIAEEGVKIVSDSI